MAERSLLLLLLLPLFITILLSVTECEAYSKTTPFEGHQPTKLTHLHFYFHDTISGNKPSAVQVAEASISNSSATSFGVIMVADDPLTEGPDPNSKEVGRAQGMYAVSGMYSFSFTMVFNFVFTEGEFNGSSVAMYGRNPIMSKVREMPIIGGTGAFRFARGYAHAKTYKLVNKDGVVEYNFFIWH